MKPVNDVEQRIVERGVTYEQRWVRCSKGNCSRCQGNAGEQGHPLGHGPYWYIVHFVHGRVRRVYIGKVLDTSRFRGVDGRINWAAVYARKRANEEARGRRREKGVVA